MRKFTACLAVLLGVTLLGGVLGMTGSAAQRAAPKASTVKIALILNDDDSPYYVTLANGAKAEAKTLGVDLTFTVPAEISAPSETETLETVTAEKPDFIIMSAVDSKAMVAPLKVVKADGIPVITVDTDVDNPSVRLGTISSDNVAGGEVAALVMDKLLSGKGEVAYEGYTPGIASVDNRHTGWLVGLKKYPGLTNVVSSYDNYSLTDVFTKVSAILERFPDLRGIFAATDNEAVGSATAVVAAGDKGKVKVVGFDGSPDEINDVRNGSVAALVLQKPYLMGSLAVREAVAYLLHKTPVPERVATSFVVVTKSNMTNPGVSRWFY
jgi:ribose transport system substrate-binding protein